MAEIPYGNNLVIDFSDPKVGIATSHDPIASIEDRADLVEKNVQSFSRRLSEKLDDLKNEGYINPNNIKKVTVFGPGLTDTAAVARSLDTNHLTIDVAEGDSNIVSEVKQQNIPAQLSFYEQTFNDFLITEQNKNDNLSNLIIFHDTGPATNTPGIGITPENVGLLAKKLDSNGVLMTTDETRGLDDILKNSGLFNKIETNPRSSTFTRGFTCWKLN